jgi:hypothetical protein
MLLLLLLLLLLSSLLPLLLLLRLLQPLMVHLLLCVVKSLGPVSEACISCFAADGWVPKKPRAKHLATIIVISSSSSSQGFCMAVVVCMWGGSGMLLCVCLEASLAILPLCMGQQGQPAPFRTAVQAVQVIHLQHLKYWYGLCMVVEVRVSKLIAICTHEAGADQRLL